MADWLTHVLIAWSAVEVISLGFPEARRFRGIALIGAIVPDLNNFTLFMGETGTRISQFLVPVQTPVGVILVILVLMFLVREESRKVTLALLALGAYLHVAADFLIRTLNGKVILFFPFSFDLYGFGIFEQGGLVFPLIAGTMAIVTTSLGYMSRKRSVYAS